MSTVADPTAELVEAEARLRQQTDEFVQSLGQQYEAFIDALDADIETPFRAAMADACEAHEACVSQWLSVEVEAESVWRSAVGYVETTARTVLRPCGERIKELATLAHLQAALSDAGSQALSTADPFPEQVALHLPLELLKSAPSDSLRGTLWQARRNAVDTMGELARQSGNAVLGLFGAEPRTRAAYVRTAEPRSHAREVASLSIGPALTRRARWQADKLIEQLSHLESEVDTWVGEVLKALAVLDRAEWHRSEAVEETTGHREALLAAADPLRKALLAASAPTDPPTDAYAFERDVVAADLDRRLSRSGTPLVSRPHRVDHIAAGSLAPNAEVWTHALADRLLVGGAIVGMRCRLSDLEDELVVSLDRAVLEPLRSSYGRIAALLGELETESDAVLASGVQPGEMSQQLEAAWRTFRSRIENTYRDLPGLTAADQALTTPGMATWRDLARFASRLPEVRALHEPGRKPERVVRLSSLDLKAQALAAFARPLDHRLGPAATPLLRAVTRVWNETELVLHIVDTAFETARTLLEDPAETASHHLPQEPESDDPRDVEALVDGGLHRAVAGLQDNLHELDDPWAELLDLAHEVILEDWAAFERSARSEDYLTQRWLGVRALLSQRMQRSVAKSRSAWDDRWSRLRALLRLSSSRVGSLVQLGRDAVGASSTELQEGSSTADSVLEASERFARLPLVYRRLFALEPLRNTALVVNRQTDLAQVDQLIEAWRGGHRAGVLGLVASPGAGLTTMLNLLDRGLEERLEVCRLRISDPSVDEPHVVRALADVLLPGQPAPADLDQLEHRIQRTRTTPRSVAVLIDDLHVLMEQRPGGTILAERLLLTAARTDATCLWIFAINDLAWQYFRQTRSSYADLVEAVSLEPWNRESLVELISARHRRSGLRVAYQPPEDPTPLLRQRLRRARSDEAVQDLLRSDFFDGLTRDAGQSPLRALFEWVRSMELPEEQDLVMVHPYRPLSYRFLGALSQEQAFALRSLLVHGRLAPEAFARLFRVSDAHAASQLEALLGLGLIEAVDPAKRGRFVVSDTPYRLRGLLVAPVRSMLEQRHFVY